MKKVYIIEPDGSSFRYSYKISEAGERIEYFEAETPKKLGKRIYGIRSIFPKVFDTSKEIEIEVKLRFGQIDENEFVVFSSSVEDPYSG